ncbi:UDP-N-acetylmuramoyl-L-alanine--D-glutamate ligase [Sutcliffiella rhizosphaerae]|uniref:UDP-N-acetylmuramoylalanine--D-glutamate ligase n=1 Tax=Sutcliffiella rhizosphaerae TaxID=2880967 RepID=A0ABN8A576_9BACI|nr:UDP-N-acetylmuramoyl-L-alanine--D-glutamate ligase [Sutcliffiella rhizosphaerae]CAG9619804.1 UDP-N-acetylmuramoylalanine--D-glutamate ligase [Sutcliffiella rhizosphaerae]
MKEINQYKEKNVLVLGLAKSGTATAELLHNLGANVTVNDRSPIEDNEQAQYLISKGITVIGGSHPLSLLDQKVDVIFKNPGIPYSNPLLKVAMEKEISILTEVELAYQISEAPYIAITGSNGKTTTTTIINEILATDEKKPLVAGNIGNVSVEVAQNAENDNVMVTELSSFQLMGIETFRPKIAILLNIFEAHLDYHGSLGEYGKAKARIFMNQTKEDYTVVNVDDEIVMELVKEASSTIIPFSTTRKVDGAYIEDGIVYFQGESIIKVDEIVLPGKHNLENILAAISAVKLYGGSNESIIHVLTSFTGVKHRLQFVDRINERKFYNDSKATNILSTQAALSSFDENVILLAGGLDRGNDFDELIPYLKNVKSLITFGETALKLINTAEAAGIKHIKHVDNVEKAVPVAYEMSESGDVILLSPACASWDQYKTFEQRGDIFINAVHKLK